ncbi:hypothetical protein COB55_02835 [Candidatus Wolfebacteria bacterium]|nr:MAG: hypothetical protein COB55_02835 [Candidatus Wolfebacteria bacterium]
MGKYINPPEKAKEEGREVDFKDTLAATLEQLNAGEVLCVVANKGQWDVAIVIKEEYDFRCVSADRGSIKGTYAVPNVVAVA